MNEDAPGYLTSEELLFLSSWRPVETDTTPSEGARWTCLNCRKPPVYFRSLARLEGAEGRFMVQCPVCDYLHVLRVDAARPQQLRTEYGGPHIDRFLEFLDRRNDGFED